jgi:hypothetical protein
MNVFYEAFANCFALFTRSHQDQTYYTVVSKKIVCFAVLLVEYGFLEFGVYVTETRIRKGEH